MKIRLKEIEQNVCPYCGSDDIEYGPSEHVDEMEYYPAVCKICGRKFEEWYRLSFVGHNVGPSLDITLDDGQTGVTIEWPDV